jgi:hypothetical protein
MAATVWTELSVAETGYQHGFADPSYDASTDYFIDFLFEGTAFFAQMPTSYTALTLAGGATPTTELTAPSTPYVELTL